MVISRNHTPQRAEREVFVVNGRAVAFYLYGAQEPGSAWALSEDARRVLAEKITEHGGRVCKWEKDADMILVAHPGGLEQLHHRYSTRRQHVKKPTFVDDCIRNGRYALKPIPQKAMGGRDAGKFREPFTKGDDRKLCKYLAQRIPDETAGGRIGRGVWDEVIQLAKDTQDPELAWALRHPADSWRERYKKNRDRLDPIIDQIVKDNPPPPDGKGLYHLSRHANHKQPHAEFMHQNAKAQFDEEEEEEEEEEEDAAGEFVAQPEDGEDGEEYHPFKKPQPARRSDRRRTDISPQKHREGSQRGDRRSAPGHMAQRQTRELSPTGEFQPNFDDLEDIPFVPSSPQAGPSGTQRTPSPARPPSKRPPVPRPIRPAAAKRPSADQVPISSQATLVNPTQPRSAVPARQEREDAARPQKRQRTHARPYVLLEPPGRTRDEELNDEGIEPEEEAQSQPAGQTNEDAEEVEDILGGRVSPAGASDVEVMDSEDERARQKLSLGRLRASGAQVQPSRAASTASRKRPLPEIEDMTAFAQGLDLGFGDAFRRASGSVGSGASALSLLRRQAQGQGGLTPSASRSLPRAPSVVESTSTSSSEKDRDPLNRVPLNGTRASAQKKKVKESVKHEEYVPEVGTRAAEVSGKRLRNRQLEKSKR
ncbi:hypothetical protein LXA43DRAFT_1082619 [Ganoderma leucocontextum]|nr:hypothetical protein LXA43DRAFT_1082619 [Ganoderma leucocontextum]